MPTDKENIVDLIKQKIKITDVAGDYGIDLKDRGSYKIGECKFHNSKGKNDFITYDNEGFLCFGCGIRGDIFNLVMKGDNCDFLTALKKLSNKAGISLKEMSPEEIDKLKQQKQEEDLILQIQNDVAEFYHKQIDDYKIGDKTIREFEKIKRGFSDDTINSLKIGYSDTEDKIVKYLLDKFHQDDILKTGLFFKYGATIKPLFQGRIVYPYFRYSNAVRFIGRQTENTPKNKYEEGKYKKQLSPSERPYISRVVENKYFYGEDTLKEDYTIITEGVTDCISLIQAGFSSISPVTVRFRKQDYSKLLSLTNRLKTVYILNDSEESNIGQKGAIETAKFLFATGIEDIRLCELPRAEDQDKIDINDYLKNKKPEEAKDSINKLLEASRQIISFLIERIPDDTIKRKQGLNEVIDLLVGKDDIIIDGFITELHNKTKIGKKELKRLLKEKKSKKVVDTTVTNTTSTTYTTLLLDDDRLLDPAGDVIEDLVIEPLGRGRYIYTTQYGLRRGLTVINYEITPDGKKNNPFIEIEGKKYYFKRDPITTLLPFAIPSVDKIKAFLEGNYKPTTADKLFVKSIKYLKLIFDLEKQEDFFMDVLGMAQTWLRPALNSIFLIGRDGTKGSGKTSFGEFTSVICRHGRTVGNLSGAVLGRVVEKYQISLHIDEIDQKQGETKEAIEGILRHSQRRDNPYSRCNKDTGDLEFFDTFNYHNFSFRTDTEDALKQRAYIERMRPTKDYRLALLTSHKNSIGYPLFEDWFFWYLCNIAKIKDKFGSVSSQVVAVTEVLEGIEKYFLQDYDKSKIDETRSKLWEIYTKELKPNQKSLLKLLVGRYSEIGYNVLHLANVLNLDIFEHIETAILTKQKEEEISDEVFLEELKEFLIILYNEKKDTFEENSSKPKKKYVLTKGSHIGRFYYSKHRAYIEFLKRLKENNLFTIGSTTFSGYLKDLRFIEGYNIKNQKITNNPERCLIFSKEVLDCLGLEEIDLLPTQEESIVDLINLIKTNENAEGVDFNVLQTLSGWQEDELLRELSRLTTIGSIFECSPNHWKVL